MVYKIVEIKYTVLHVMQSCTKKANVMYTGQGIKEQVSQDLKDGFLMFLLINRLLMLILSFYLLFYDFFVIHIFVFLFS